MMTQLLSWYGTYRRELLQSFPSSGIGILLEISEFCFYRVPLVKSFSLFLERTMETKSALIFIFTYHHTISEGYGYTSCKKTVLKNIYFLKRKMHKIDILSS